LSVKKVVVIFFPNFSQCLPAAKAALIVKSLLCGQVTPDR